MTSSLLPAVVALMMLACAGFVGSAVPWASNRGTVAAPRVPARAQTQCAGCAGTSTSAVCAQNAQARALTFVNSCWLERNNCLNPTLRYTFVKSGYCDSAQPSFSVTGADGNAGHRNAYLINSAACGRLPLGSKILNGRDAGLFQYPWAVHLAVEEPARGQSFTCGGSVISERYVLTAAHCSTGFPTPIRIVARVGDYVLSTAQDCAAVSGRSVCAPAAQALDVEQISPHPRYDNTPSNGFDLALLRLRQALYFGTDAVKPVCLPLGLREENRVFNGEMMTVIGWGITASGRSADVLQATTVPGVSNSACAAAYGGARVLDAQLCAGGNARDSCSGDSGGAIMFTSLAGNKMVEYGLVSYGVECGAANVPGVYTRVGSYVGWILDTMRV